MYIVLDANIWISQLGLRSTIGAALRFFIKQSGAQLALPEVIRLEVERNMRRVLQKQVDDVAKNHRELLAVFGKLKAVVLPTSQDIDEKVAQLFSSLEMSLVEPEFSLEDARSALLKTIDNIAPCEKSQQYKDAAIWACCLRLLETDSVALITADKAFYKGQDPQGGLAVALRIEASGKPHTLEIYPEISKLLAVIKRPVNVNEDELIRAALEAASRFTDPVLVPLGLTIHEKISADYQLFGTDNADVLAIRFQLKFSCVDVVGIGRRDGVLELEGEGSFQPIEQSFSDLIIDGPGLNYFEPDGTHKVSKSINLRCGPTTSGHRDVFHQVQFSLD